MNNPKPLSQRMDLAQQIQTFTGLTKPNEQDRFFLIVGAPGSGKTSFVTRCTDKEPLPTKGLPKCTEIIRISHYEHNNRRIHLIDTPGFNDPKYSDTQTLATLTAYLSASYANGVRIHGVLMMQSLQEPKIPFSIIHNLKMVMAMCGFNWYRHFGLAITRPFEGHRRVMSEKTLLDTYFAHLLETDMFIKRWNLAGSRDKGEQTESARDIIGHMVSLSDEYPAEIMRIQREVFRERRALDQTVVGAYVGAELRVSERSYRSHARSIAGDWVRSLEEGRFEEAAELKVVKGDLERYLDDVLEDIRILGMSFEGFHDEGKKDFLRGMDGIERDLYEDIKKRQRDLREYEEGLDRVCGEVLRGNLRRSLTGHRETTAIIAEYEEAIRVGKDDMTKAQDVYKKFNERTDRVGSQIGLGGDGLVCSVM